MAFGDKAILIGIKGENNARQIELDVGEILDVNPAAAIVLYVQRDGDEYPYIVTGTTVAGRTMIWTPTDTDTSIAGPVLLQIVGIVNEEIVKTIVLQSVVLNALGASPVPPPALQPWVDAMAVAIAKVDSMSPSTDDDLAHILGT